MRLRCACPAAADHVVEEARFRATQHRVGRVRGRWSARSKSATVVACSRSPIALGALTRAGPGVGAFENDPEPIAGEHDVPVDRVERVPMVECSPHSTRPARSLVRQAREAARGTARPAHRRQAPFSSGQLDDQRAEVEERVADRRELPVDDGRELRTRRGGTSRWRCDSRRG